jgi:hypothetical protein
MSKLLKNTAYYTIGNFTSKAVNFLLLPLYTSYLTPDEYGIVNSMQVFSNILLIFFTLGLERAIYRLYHDFKTEKGQKDFLGTVSISIAVISLLVGGILFLLNSPIGKIYKSIEFHPYYTYAILTALFMTYDLVPKISFQVKEQANKFLILSLVILAFRIMPVIWQVVYLEAGAAGMLKGAMIGNAVWFQKQPASQIAELMEKAEFGIFPASTVAIEACAMRLPFICGYFVENQKDIYNGIKKYNLAVCVGDLNKFQETQLREAVKTICLKNRYESIIKQQTEFMDNQSDKRLLKIFQEL